MNGLPSNWAISTLDEVGLPSATTVDPSRFQEEVFDLFSVPAFARGKPDVVTGAEIGSTKRMVEPGDVLLCKIVPHINRVWVVPERCQRRQIASSEWIVVRNGRIDPQYLQYCLSGPDFRRLFLRDLSGIGGSLTRARPQAVKKIPVPIAPRDEQRRIVTKLRGLLSHKHLAYGQLSRISTLIGHYNREILNKAFSGDLTAEWRAVRSRSEPAEVQLGSVASDLSYGSSAKSSAEGRVPVLRMGNIQNGRLDWSDLVYTDDEREIGKYRLAPGDVLFNRTNSPELVGKTALYSGGRPAVYAGYLIRIRCNSLIAPEYLTYCLNSPAGRDYCWRVKTDGVSQSNINAKRLGAFTLRLPELDEQAEIVRQVEAAFGGLDIVAAEHGKALHLLDQLEKQILSKAFRGELVTQRPSDEPAHELLGHLDIEHSERPKRGPRRQVRSSV